MNPWYECLDVLHAYVYDFSPPHMVGFLTDMYRIRQDPRHCFCQNFHYNWSEEATREHQALIIELFFNFQTYTYILLKDLQDFSVEVFDNVYRHI